MDEPHSSSAAFPCEAESPWWVWQRPAFFHSLSLLPQPSPCSLRTAGCMLPVHHWNTKTTAFSNSNLYTMPTAQSAILTFIQHQHCIQQFWPLYNTNTIFSNSFFFFFFFWRKELQHQHTPTPTPTHTHTHTHTHNLKQIWMPVLWNDIKTQEVKKGQDKTFTDF